MPYVGINIGAVTVQMACIDGEQVSFRVENHRGQPLQVVREFTQGLPADNFFGVCGHLGHISEVAATEAVLAYVGGHFDAVASLGGESFTLYLLEDAKILGVLAHNRCAAGTGEFLVQQIGRLGLTLEQAIAGAFNGHVVPMASRCSVHCKSDITHKLNRNEASVNDILRTLHDMMANGIVALLDKARRPVQRLLVVGGVSRNRALISALQSKCADLDIVVLRESACFQALGAAVLTRDSPAHKTPLVATGSAPSRLPPLSASDERVNVIPALAPAPQPSGPVILGVDAGSTTTKAVLLDGDSHRVIAAYYGPTHGDPITATRRCLTELATQTGNRRHIERAGSTGSARDLVGAYLGSAHVYNEISAHAVGAAEFDPQVDTIFEIGGQDAKYILLRNGVPIDYAMNTACSAGTGSFLEEVARNDLGLAVEDIAACALRAAAPVRFTATCAAFINSEIRSAMQRGCSREDIAGGLVYAIVSNYLTKVKGPRAVGSRVFFQGGVARNRAVGHAFAQCLGREVVIPPQPELLGAIGVALLTLNGADQSTSERIDLQAMASRTMNRLGQFTCHGCDNCCVVERFEVAGRRFPFGGRCCRFENVWKRKRAKPAPGGDVVEARNRLLFSDPVPPSRGSRRRLGIPRALTTHSLYPLYSTLFAQLGFDVRLSGIDPSGSLKANSGFCFPIQIAHGGVVDLLRQGVERVFLPHVKRMPNPNADVDSHLCPLAQATPYCIAKAFPDARLLSPVLDFAAGYRACTELVDLAVVELGLPRRLAERAYRQAVAAQLRAESAMAALGRQALADALRRGDPTIILVGRSYNAFPPEVSQSVSRKLVSMGIRVIPGDCLPQTTTGQLCWHHPNVIMNAVELVRRHANLFLLCISNFGCTIDAFVHSLVSANLGSKPYLTLEIDAHTADAGVQTRLEAFLEVIGNHRGTPVWRQRFKPVTVDGHGMVSTATGARIPITDPRIMFYFFSFSYYHSLAARLAGRWLGLNVGPPIEFNRGHLERGLRHTSGRECLPLPITIGQMLEANEHLCAPGEIQAFHMLGGGAPCVVTCYADYLRRFVRDHQLKNVLIVDPRPNNGNCGLNPRKMAQALTPAMTVADLFVEMDHTLGVVGGPDGREQLRACWDQHVCSAGSAGELRAGLPTLVERVAAIPHGYPAQCPKVVVTGDFFTRFNALFVEGIHELYARHRIILLPADLNEQFQYGAYSRMVSASEAWRVAPDSLQATASACLRVLNSNGRDFLVNRMNYEYLQYYETLYRRYFERTGLLTRPKCSMGHLFEQATRHISPAIFGEAIPTVGHGVTAHDTGYDGVIVIGPLNCLPFRISEAILKPHCIHNGVPILTYESDGHSVPLALLREVEVHIEQVLRTARQRKAMTEMRSRAGQSEHTGVNA